MKVCIFGASSDSLNPVFYSDAKELGAGLAAAGHSLVYGGSERGIMKACADGVLQEGGKLTAVAPSFFKDFGVLSSRCAEVIYTDTMSERKQAMEDISDAFIVLPGGIGTFDEFFETMTLKQLNIHSKPMAILNTLNFYDDMINMLSNAAEKGFLSEGCLKLFRLCSSPNEAIDYIQSPDSHGVRGRGLNYDK